MLDLHLHLLPAVDDGPQTLDESLEMVGLAKSLGFTTLVATPHLQERLDSQYQQLVDARTDTVRSATTDAGIQVLGGYEIRIDPGLPAWLHEGDPITIAGSRTVLVELPFSGWPTFTERVLFDTMDAGYRVLLAHPERYTMAMQNPDLLLALHDQGVLFQVTTGSVAGLFGKSSRDLADLLFRAGAVDILASDAHSAGRRFVSVSEGLERAASMVGEERVRELTLVNPRAILEDADLKPARVPETVFDTRRARSPLARVRQMLPGR